MAHSEPSAAADRRHHVLRSKTFQGIGRIEIGRQPAPLTAAILLFELTRDYDVVLPLLCSAGVAALVVELNGRPRGT